MDEEITLYASGLLNQGKIIVSKITSLKPDDSEEVGYMKFKVQTDIAKHILQCQKEHDRTVACVFNDCFSCPFRDDMACLVFIKKRIKDMCSAMNKIEF